MPKINVLPREVAELIAAGEVVERPSSVVKELLENSIDAGATKITLEIKNGGITFIRITDNGCGIAAEDVPTAFISHATSKISSGDDLNAIYTLGFRGEALASIAAVSRTEMMTRRHEDETGTRCVVEGGEIIQCEDVGCPKGTTVIVRDLFYNTPARMKFLKKDVSEANNVAGVIDRIALSHPEISVRFIRDGKETVFTPGDGKLESAVYQIFGKEFLDGLIPVKYASDGIEISGFTSKPTSARPNRSMQFFFINGRFVKTGTGAAALSEAYKNSIIAGKFPYCVLNISLIPETVDVNVHPAKTEVRFANEKTVFNTIYYAVKNALDGDHSHVHHALDKPPKSALTNYNKILQSGTQLKLNAERLNKTAAENPFIKRNGFFAEQTAAEFKKSYGQDKNDDENIFFFDDSSSKKREPPPEREFDFLTDAPKKAEKKPEEKPERTAEEKDIAAPESRIEKPAEKEPDIVCAVDDMPHEFRVIGEAFKTYIIVEQDDKIIIIDKHAAHERIIFEELKKREGGAERQILLTPVTVTLSKEEYSAVLENTDVLEKSGFSVGDFGGGAVLVSECPVILCGENIADSVMELAGYLAENKNIMVPEKIDWIYHSTACRAAVKAGDFTSDYEMNEFVKKLFSMPDIKCCPHGRPVMIEMTRREMEKSFGRV
ncbi:MAG: DNA mismatch repair endonuclease MutL [Clostridiales bacterium]|nr:DNA mismatch repair endonuclease MutL [Clostridiales bacterium]